MKNILVDMVKQVAPLFEKVRITGNDSTTKVEAYTDDKMLFLVAELKNAVPEFLGEFGISNLPLLKGLLDFPSYKADAAKLDARRLARDNIDYLSELVFQDGHGGRAIFRTINPRMIGDRAHIAAIPWNVSVSPTRAKLAEVMQLTSMYTQYDQHFGVIYEDRTLLLTIGGKGASNHNAMVPLADDIEPGPLPLRMVFRAPHFVSVLKNVGNYPCTIRFAKDGVAGVQIETDYGEYNYILRGTEN